MPDLSSLYQDIILDHNRRPRNYGALEGATRRVEGRNPLCGDELTLWVRLDGDTISDVRFVGTGCAVSRASASLMTTAVKGKTRAEAEALFDRFHGLVTGRDRPVEAAGRDATSDRMAPFAGISRFPVRVKCASLAWHALRSALGGGGEEPELTAVSTE
jgi:nitrogen fixation NifU-like protein